jgi:MinD-like ATPase involved in chromosome partitioning or flagellar assembly
VNLAVALASKFQLKVGLLDADVYGPNIPIMMNINTKPEVTLGIYIFQYFCIKYQHNTTETLDTTLIILTCSHW